MFSCFFIGHGHTGQEVYPLLAGAVERLILDGVEEFLVGRYGQFDAMAARAVRTAKERHASVTLLLLEPYYRPEAAPPEGFDAVYYPPGLETAPKRAAIARANRAAVDGSTHLLAYVKRPGRARDVLEYALRRERRGLICVLNLAQPIEGMGSEGSSCQ